MTANQIAMIVWGLLTVILTFVVAQIVGSFWGMVLAVFAAGTTYVFQTLEEITQGEGNAWLVLVLLWAIVVAAIVAAWGFILCA